MSPTKFKYGQNEKKNEEHIYSIKKLFMEKNEYLSNRVDLSIRKFLSSTDEKSSFNKEELINKYSLFEIPQVAKSVQDYMNDFDDQIISDCSHLASPRYLGHMTSPLPNFIPEIGRIIQTLNQNMVKMETSRGLTILEKQMMALIHKEIFGLKQDFYDASILNFSETLGIFTSGGTLANVSALWAAKNNLINHKKDKKMVVIGSELMHYSFDKATEILGLELIKLSVNQENIINLLDLKSTIAECENHDKTVIAIVAIAGSTDFGSVDPLEDICSLGKEKNIYIHIDAAWGGGFIFSEYKEKFLAGINLADSVTIDGHKQLMMPIGCGMLLFKDPKLSKAIAHYAPYAVREKSLDQGKYTLEGTRPANMLYLHACFNLIGRNGYNEIFQLAIKNTQFMAEYIEQSDSFELMSKPFINILTYRYIPSKYRGKKLSNKDNDEINQFNELLQKRQRKIGRGFVSRTTRAITKYNSQKLILLRAVILNPLTTKDDIEFVLKDQLNIAYELEQ